MTSKAEHPCPPLLLDVLKDYNLLDATVGWTLL